MTGGSLINSDYWNGYSGNKTMLLTAEARVQMQGSLYGNYGGQSVRERGFVTAWVFPCHYHPASAQYTYFSYLLPILYNLNN